MRGPGPLAEEPSLGDGLCDTSTKFSGSQGKVCARKSERLSDEETSPKDVWKLRLAVLIGETSPKFDKELGLVGLILEASVEASLVRLTGRRLFLTGGDGSAGATGSSSGRIPSADPARDSVAGRKGTRSGGGC